MDMTDDPLNVSMDESGQPHKKEPLDFWRLAATMSSLGWSLVVSIVGGALLGHYLDRVTGREFAWTIGLLSGGVAISLYNLYHILYKETQG
jgi:predicted F0F1-ATPase subunit